jgi:hypothetical protein
MAYTRTLVANLTLGHLGDSDIDDIDNQQSQNAQVLSTRYEHARDWVYVQHDWHWARRSAQLQQSVTPPTVRYDWAYSLPNDFARISNVSEFENMDPQLDEYGWDIVGGKLTTNAGYAFVDYVSNNWSEAIWPAYFADCVALKLAEVACLKITHNNGLKETLNKQLMQSVLPQARSIDSTAQPSRPRIIASPWQRARLGRGSGSNLRRP